MWVHLWAFRAGSIDTFNGFTSCIELETLRYHHLPHLIEAVPHLTPFTLQSQIEVAPPPAMVVVPTSEDAHAHMDRIGCPRIHLRLYSIVMRAHDLDEASMIMLFPMSLSGATQRWFASLDRPMRQSHHSFPVRGRRLPRSLIGHLRGIRST
ncbi:hypothetical protein AAG906_017123 [Vitis piasezkii]